MTFKMFDSDNMGFGGIDSFEAIAAERLDPTVDIDATISATAVDRARARTVAQLDHRLLTADEEASLLTAAADGDEDAREMLVRYNQRLVADIARKFTWAGARDGHTIEDLRQYGNIGLITAIDRFDADKDVRLSTYATLYIRSEIMKGLGASGFITLPYHKARLASRLPGLRLDLEAELQRPPLGSELLQAVIDRKLATGLEREDLTVETLNALMSARIEPLDAPMTDDDDGELASWQETVSSAAARLDIAPHKTNADEAYSGENDDEALAEARWSSGADPEDILIDEETANIRKEFIQWLLADLKPLERNVLMSRAMFGREWTDMTREDWARKKNGKPMSTRGLGFTFKRAMQAVLDRCEDHGISQREVRILLTA